MDSSPRRGLKSDSKSAHTRTLSDADRLRLVSNGEEQSSAIRRTPPTFPFRYFRTAIAGLKSAGTLPHHIDRSVWSNKHFDVTDDDLLPAFHFLGLIDEADCPLPLLTELIASFGTLAWPQHLQKMLQTAYGDILSVGIAQASPKHMLGMFRKRFGLDAIRARVAAGFFVHAARESQLDIGPFLAAPQRQASAPSAAQISRERMTTMMLTRLPPFDEAWNEDVKLAWLAALREIAGSLQPGAAPKP